VVSRLCSEGTSSFATANVVTFAGLSSQLTNFQAAFSCSGLPLVTAHGGPPTGETECIPACGTGIGSAAHFTLVNEGISHGPISTMANLPLANCAAASDWVQLT